MVLPPGHGQLHLSKHLEYHGHWGLAQQQRGKTWAGLKGKVGKVIMAPMELWVLL